MFSKPMHPEKKPKETRKVTFNLSKNTVAETYPAKYIRRQEQIYPEAQENQAYDRRTAGSKRRYVLNYNNIMSSILRNNIEIYWKIREKETIKSNKKNYFRKEILKSDKIMSLWKPVTTPPFYNQSITEPISSDEDSE
tara:strand:- start:6124 stop:6537 length:414 start_codon:yes stop_codon:yes gene_type:complete